MTTTTTPQPYEHIPGASVGDIAAAAPENRALKIASESDPKKIAGAIAQIIRLGNGGPPALLANGEKSINQAIKAIAISRSYLEEENIDLIAQPEFFNDSARCTIRLRKIIPLEERDASELTCTVQSDPYKTAGAIAGKVRDGERVDVTAKIGPVAVFNTVKAIAVSRSYLKEENIDVKFVPDFIQTEWNNNDEMNAITFRILTRQLD